MHQNIKLQIVQQFDPDTDYSQFEEAELDGAFEATVYELLQKVQNYQEPKIEIPEKGDTVQWKYGRGIGSGKVTKIYTEPVTLKLGENDSEITRNGTEENPALLITHPNGSQVLKLASDITIPKEIELEEPVIAYSFDFGGKYDHIDLSPTKGMIKSAKTALDYIKNGFAGDGMEKETIRWVKLVADGKPLSLEKAKKGYKFFQRHNYYKDTKNQGDTNPNQPAPWYVARMAWFGDDGESFFNRVWRQIQAVDNQDTVNNSENTMSKPLEFGAIIHKVIKWNGLDIGCEYRPGEVRFPGRRNSRKLRCGYGHIRGYRDNTGEAPDVYLAPGFFIDGETPSDHLFKVSQLSPEDGDFDEPKYMCGFSDIESAKAAYLREMPLDYFGGIEEVYLSELEQYKKPVDYSEVLTSLAEVKTQILELNKTPVIQETTNIEELRTDLSEIKELLQSQTASSYSEFHLTLQQCYSEIEELKKVVKKQNTQDNKLEKLVVSYGEKLEVLTNQVIEFATTLQPIKIEGSILDKEELKTVAEVDEESVQKAIEDWKENVPEYKNLLDNKGETVGGE